MLPSELFQCENIPVLHKYVEYKAISIEIISFVTEIEFANFANSFMKLTYENRLLYGTIK